MKPEILAPCGNTEAFLAAVSAGADAVYAGLKDFSARAKAKNFSYKQLAEICSYAKEKNVKVFVTLNTLIKESEIKDVIKNLEYISSAGAGGVIVQDLGVVQLIKKYFPHLNLHASTQLVIHNSYGAKQAEKAGFKRAVLARELSFEEIKSIRNNTKIELEIFCHGALCFCVSGMCLFSSFIGGYSGNRGRCTQPCRRLWTADNKSGYYLSPKDFQLIEYVKQIQNTGINSLKIEGRLKSPDYVAKTVRAYRMLIDCDEKNFKETLKTAKEILSFDYARQKTTFNFISKNENIFEPQKSKNTGLLLGTVEDKTAENFKLKTKYILCAGDVLRLTDKKHDKSYVMKTEKIVKQDGGYLISYKNIYLENGFEVYKTADASTQSVRSMDVWKNGCTETAIKKINVATSFLSGHPNIHSSIPLNLPLMFVRINNLKWLNILEELKIGMAEDWKRQTKRESAIVIKLSKNNIFEIKKLNNPKNFYFELPAYIDEEDLSLFQTNIDFLISKGCQNFFINNISQLYMFERKIRKEQQTKPAIRQSGIVNLYSGQYLYTLNSCSAEFLSKYGVCAFTTSWEDDLFNIKDLSKILKNNLIVYLSGFPEVVTSKMKFVKEIENKKIKSGVDEFKVISNGSENFIIPKFPINLLGFKNRLAAAGIKSFAIDLSYIEPNVNYLTQILRAFNNNLYINSANKFNFERKFV